MNSESSNTTERCHYGGGLDSIEWTNTASGGDTQLLKNEVIELMRWEWSGVVAESELHKGRQPVQVLYVGSVVHVAKHLLRCTSL